MVAVRSGARCPNSRLLINKTARGQQTNMHEILRQRTVRKYIIVSASEPSDILLLRPRRNENKCLFVRVMSMCCNMCIVIIYNKDIINFSRCTHASQWHIV